VLGSRVNTQVFEVAFVMLEGCLRDEVGVVFGNADHMVCVSPKIHWWRENANVKVSIIFKFRRVV